MVARYKNGSTGRSRHPGASGLIPYVRPDGTCLGRFLEEPEEPVPVAPAEPEAQPVDPTEPMNPA